MAGGASPRRRGNYFERKVKLHLEAQGWLVVQTRASRTAADMWAIHSIEEGEFTHPGGRSDDDSLIRSCPCIALVLGVQAKLDGRIDPAERVDLVELCRRAGALPVLASNRPFSFRLVSEAGTSDLPGGNKWLDLLATISTPRRAARRALSVA